MVTPKKKSAMRQPTPTEVPARAHSADYVALVEQFSAGVERMQQADWAGARTLFDSLSADNRDEPTLAERARTYARICQHRQAEAPAVPATAEERHAQAVFLCNNGAWDAAIQLLDQNLAEGAASARDLYVRAGSWAQKKATDKAVADLRQAIALEPQVKFQALNEPDFEPIREEPAFIDLVEPTPTGV